jgi:hypothetical protein
MTPEMEVALQATQISADSIKAIAMAIAAGVGVFGPGIGIGMLVARALEAIGRDHVYWYRFRGSPCYFCTSSRVRYQVRVNFFQYLNTALLLRKKLSSMYY